MKAAIVGVGAALLIGAVFYKSPHEEVAAKLAVTPVASATLGTRVIASGAFVATTPLWYDEMTRLAVAKDEAGIRRMAARGEVLVATGGESVAVIQRELSRLRIRFQSGAHAGKDGWIASEHIQ